MIEQLPEMPSRVGTGPVRFGRDWPGYYMQANRAWWCIGLLEFAKKNLDEKYHDAYNDMINSLRECTVKGSEYSEAFEQFKQWRSENKS